MVTCKDCGCLGVRNRNTNALEEADADYREDYRSGSSQSDDPVCGAGKRNLTADVVAEWRRRTGAEGEPWRVQVFFAGDPPEPDKAPTGVDIAAVLELARSCRGWKSYIPGMSPAERLTHDHNVSSDRFARILGAAGLLVAIVSIVISFAR